MDLTQETVLTFLLEHGGKVKNSELVTNFKCQINCSDPAEKKHNRDLFKKYVNSVAVVKQIDDVKFVVVKKRYQDFVKEGMHYTAQTPDLDDSLSSQNTSFSPCSSEGTVSFRCKSGKIMNSDIENNNSYYSSSLNGSFFNDNVKPTPMHIHDPEGFPYAHSGVVGAVRSCKPNTETPTVKVLNVSSDQAIKKGKTGVVFAVVAVTSPPQSPRASLPVKEDEFSTNHISQLKTSEKPNMLPQRTLPSPEPKIPNYTGRKSSEHHTCTSPGRTNRLVEEAQTPGSPQLRRPQNKTAKQGEEAKYSESVPLEPAAHEWLVKSAAGLWGQIYGLLLQDSQLAEKKDFISGFTALHWAAKGGNSEMVRNIMDISKKRGTCVDVNTRTNGGYTPLHIAAIHGHDSVMALLVQVYGANAHIRDNNGKKPYHYMGTGVSPELRELLGAPQVARRDRSQERSEEDDFRELPKGLNTLSRLFQPHIGHRKKHKHQQQGISSIGED